MAFRDMDSGVPGFNRETLIVGTWPLQGFVSCMGSNPKP